MEVYEPQLTWCLAVSPGHRKAVRTGAAPELRLGGVISTFPWGSCGVPEPQAGRSVGPGVQVRGLEQSPDPTYQPCDVGWLCNQTVPQFPHL